MQPLLDFSLGGRQLRLELAGIHKYNLHRGRDGHSEVDGTLVRINRGDLMHEDGFD
jgi:hypothetical protein